VAKVFKVPLGIQLLKGPFVHFCILFHHILLQSLGESIAVIMQMNVKLQRSIPVVQSALLLV
jgi:hypothetical protein